MQSTIFSRIQTSSSTSQFNQHFLFDDRPCVIVVCDPVLFELDGLKNGDSDYTADRDGNATQFPVDFKAREAIRAINTALDDGDSLPQHVQIERYHKRLRQHASSSAKKILRLTELYAEENAPVTVLLLTSDLNLHNLAHGSTVQAIDPHEWQEERRRDHLLRLAYALDGTAVQEAHDEYVGLEDQLAQLPDDAGAEQVQKLEDQVRQASSEEKRTLERLRSKLVKLSGRIYKAMLDEAVREAHDRRKRFPIGSNDPS